LRTAFGIWLINCKLNDDIDRCRQLPKKSFFTTFPAVSDKFRLCFEFGICTEEDIQANHHLETADSIPASAASTAAPAVTTTRTPTRRTTTAPAVRSGRYNDLKVSRQMLRN
jgi:hypothetical protein